MKWIFLLLPFGCFGQDTLSIGPVSYCCDTSEIKVDSVPYFEVTSYILYPEGLGFSISKKVCRHNLVGINRKKQI